MTRRLKKIAIVGGGVSGLLSLRHILRYPHLRPTLFEGTNDIGGVWVYDGKQNRYRYENIDHQKTPLSVYRNLISNQSKQIMEFCDFKHENTSLPTFVHHEYVLDYLKRFSNNYQLESYIRLNHRVTNILPVFCPTNDFLHWKVEVAHKDREPVAHIFDAVAVCSGHFTTPNIPQLPGLQYFRGEILHSRYYRRPEDFYDKTVLVIGAGISGLDIALDISRFSTKNIYVSNRGDPLVSQLPGNMGEVSQLKSKKMTNKSAKYFLVFSGFRGLSFQC